jgi:hypothetical protein
MKLNQLLKGIILENSRMDFLVDKFVDSKTDKKLTPEELFSLVVADPLSVVDENTDVDDFNGDFSVVKKVGPYTQWLISNFFDITTPIDPVSGEPISPETKDYETRKQRIKNLFWENLYKVTDDLVKFHRYKERLEVQNRDINKLDFDELSDLVKDFTLEKKGTKKEKEEAKKTFEYPGSEIIFRGKDWVVVKISDKGPQGKEAAKFFGGYGLKPSVGETNWCTSITEDKWNRFDSYIKTGPLYVILPTTDAQYGDKTGLPANRYQFHFQDNQFMDKNDKPIDLVDYLNGPMKELKLLFKEQFEKSLVVGDGTEFSVDSLDHGSIGKYISLYGFDEVFDSLPDNVEEIYIQNRGGKQDISYDLPPSIGRFKNLKSMMITNILKSVPEEICSLNNLKYLGFPDNPNLNSLPECLGNLPNLKVLSLVGQKMSIPESIKNNFTQERPGMFMKSNKTT